MNILPKELPELRARTVESMASVEALGFFQERSEGRVLNGHAPDVLQGWEVERLRSADLFYISEPMAALAKASSKSLPPYTLEPEDVPTRAGFAFIAPGAFQVVSTVEPIAAICWGQVEGGIFVTLYADTDLVLQTLLGRGKCTSEQARVHRGLVGALSPMAFEGVIPYYKSERDVEGVTEEPLLRTLRAAWLLMQQPLAQLEDVRADRHARKRLMRAGHEPGTVRVIRLRRPSSPSAGSGTDREYHHQWIVRGHWRQQWYPSREVHRPVWIAPHVKGPEGAPLLGGEKVHAWVR